MNDRAWIYEIYFVPETSRYSYSIRFEGRPSHHKLDTCLTLDDALIAADPHNERIWEDAVRVNEGNSAQARWNMPEDATKIR